MSADFFETMIDRISKVDKDMDVINRLVATNEIISFALEVAVKVGEGEME